MQPALKQDGVTDEVLRLAEQIGAVSARPAAPALASGEHDASSLARRFAPPSARLRAAAADPTVLPPVEPARGHGTKRRTTLLAAGATAAAVIIGGVFWLGGFGGSNASFPKSGAATRPAASALASAALSIPIDPPAPGHATLSEHGGAEAAASVSPSLGFVVRSGESDRIEGLMAHGREMIEAGYLAGARAYYRRAAEAGSGEAAIAVGATYDPDIIARLGVFGLKPDRAEAAKWYARAAGLGVADRDSALHAVTDAWGETPHDAAGPDTTVAAAMKPAVTPPLRKPGTATASTAAASEEPKQQVASSQTYASGTVRPQLLASEGDAEKLGPLSMLVKAAAGASAQEQWMEVASPVNIRQGPSSSSGTDKVAPRGTKFRVVGREGNWIRVVNPKTQREGYIYSRFLKETSAP